MIKSTEENKKKRFKQPVIETSEEEFDQKIIEVARVSRVMAGGKRMRFRAVVVVGDYKGKVGLGLAKAADVGMAIGKASRRAKKNIITVPLRKGTIPHIVSYKYGAARVLLKPAAGSRGVKAGGVMRIILELAGVTGITGKMLGSDNKMNNSRATIAALKLIKHAKKDK